MEGGRGRVLVRGGVEEGSSPFVIPSLYNPRSYRPRPGRDSRASQALASGALVNGSLLLS